MANIVSIGATTTPEAVVAEPRLTALQAPQQALNVTEKAVKRIRIAMAKEGIALTEGGMRLGVMGGGCSGL